MGASGAGPPAAPPRIPLFDLRLRQRDLEAVARTLREGRLSMGPRTEAFERAFAEQLGARHAVAVSSCTAALHLAYLAAGVGPGDEVVVPTHTFVATAATVVQCGATPVFADVAGPDDLGVDPGDVEARITPRTRAVAVVHYGGYAAPADRLARLCEERGLSLVEDAAHTPSATLQGRRLGTFGLAGCFSFFSNKVLSVGEGGLVATDDDRVATLARELRSPEGAAGRPGFNYRFDEPRAALLLSRLDRLDEDIVRRRELTMRYRQALREIDGVHTPYRDADVDTSSCYVMPVLVDPARRDGLRERLAGRGIQTSVLYPAVHELSAYRERFGATSLERGERAARSVVCLPLFPELTEEQQDRVVAELREALA